MKMEQSVPKRRHINFRRRVIAQKKESIQHTEHGESLKSRTDLGYFRYDVELQQSVITR